MDFFLEQIFPKTYLNELVPARGDNDGVLGVGREAHARNPLGVALLGDGEFAVTKGVPQLDAPVTGTGNDLAVVGRERDGQDIIGVADEAAGGGAGGELPEAESLVPRGRESVSTVGGDNLHPEYQQMKFPFPRPRRNNSGSGGFERTQSETMWE